MSEKKRPRVMVDMSATLIHHGHIRLLKKASEIGDVVVALTTDDEIKQKKRLYPGIKFRRTKRNFRVHQVRLGSGSQSLAYFF